MLIIVSKNDLFEAEKNRRRRQNGEKDHREWGECNAVQPPKYKHDFNRHLHSFFSLFAPLAISYQKFVTLLLSLVFLFFFGSPSKCVQKEKHLHANTAFHAIQSYFGFVTHAAYTNACNCYIVQTFQQRQRNPLTINREHTFNSGKCVNNIGSHNAYARTLCIYKYHSKVK